MGHDTPKQQEPQESTRYSCELCGMSLTLDAMSIVQRSTEHSDKPRYGRTDLRQDEKSSWITRMARSQTAREVANLFALCHNCNRRFDNEVAPPAPQIVIDTNVHAAAAALAPTQMQLRAKVRAVKAALRVTGVELSCYQVEHTVTTALIGRWRDVAQYLEVQHGSPAGEARSLAVRAARDALSAAIELRQTYLSNDTDVSLTDRNAAVVEFGQTWLGWRSPVKDERVEALIDALLGDDWPSEWHEGTDDVRPLVRKLVRRHGYNWRSFFERQRNGQLIISLSTRTNAPSGESAELIDFIHAPGFQAEPANPIVRSVLSELDPLEQEVWHTYANYPGRRSWKKAAQLNGQPGSFGEDRVRRKILSRLQPYKHNPTGRRHTHEA